jgi:phosphoribosylglycinamide formyltransferase-1
MAAPLFATDEQRAIVTGKRVLVMGSGSGSNFEALVTTLRPLGLHFAGLFCDRPGARILDRAQRLGVPATTPPSLPKDSNIHPKRHLNNAVMDFLSQPFDVLALAGYLRILPTRVVQPHHGKILNIHPSLLPKYPGLHAIKQAYDAGDTTIGITVHIVTEGVDEGPILGQSSLQVLPNETLEEVETRIHALEHTLYPNAIIDFLAGTAQAVAQPTETKS